MEYLLKVSAIVVVFYICYKLFLQKTTFFNENRWFLLAGLITAFSIPFIVIPMYIESAPMVFSELVTETNLKPVTNLKPILNTTPIVVEETEKTFSILNYLPIIYGLGVVFFGVKFIIQIVSLSILILKNKRKKESRFTFIETSTNQSPFSFFNWIIYNPNNFVKTELQHILTHEKIHAVQKHSIDVLLAQISCVVLWFNPFIWLYNKSIKQNLEFIADLRTQEKLGCSSTYQKTLLKVCVSVNQLSISNNFYSSFIKKRIVMLNKSKSKKVNLIKFAIVLPVLAIFLMNFNTKEIYVENKSSNRTLNNLAKNKPEEFIIYNHFSDEKMQEFKKELKSKGFDFELKEVKRNTEDQITGIDFEVEKNGTKGEYGIKRPTPLKTTVIRYYKESNKFDIKTLEFFNSEELNAKSKNVVKIVFDKNSNVEQLKKQQKELKEKYDVDFTFIVFRKSNGDEFDGYSYEFNNNISKAISLDEIPYSTPVILKYNVENKMFSLYIENENNDNSHGMVMFMDKTYAFGIFSNFSNEDLDRNKKLMKKSGIIAEFSEIKRDENNQIIAISIRAKKNDGKVATFKVEGKKPIIEIDMFHYESSNVIVFEQYKKTYFNNPIYILDGKEITKENYKKIIKDDNYSRELLNLEKAVKKYGDKGKNGVLEITTKKVK